MKVARDVASPGRAQPGRLGRVAGGAEDRFAAELDDLHPLLHRLELQAADLGLAVAPLYLASARGSLRHVAACLAHQRPGRGDLAARDGELCPGTSLRLGPVEARPGIGERVRVTGRRAEPVPGADIAAWAGRADLGADLMSSPGARTLCRGPVGAALLHDALARHRWLHRASGAKWSTDISGAHALVAALTGGAGFPLAGPTATAGLVDWEVAELLAGLGWLRLVSPSMPGQVVA